MNTTESGRMDGWLMVSDGVIDKECSGVGMIYGLHYGEVDTILDELIENYGDFSDDEISIENGCINFEISNVYHSEGQMTFPETGQWDFPPHYEFNYKIISVEVFPDPNEAELIDTGIKLYSDEF